jgi:dTDP-4-dehydrorhamnose reductase
MRVLVTGAGGNVGRGLVSRLAAEGHAVTGRTHADLDITDYAAVVAQVRQIAPEVVIHAAAMTAVDRCAEQPDLALTVNALGAHSVALACSEIGAAMCYISTNEVFNAERSTPALEYDPVNPANPYGYSKWVGEQVVREVLPRHYVVRTSWVFAHGGNNFVQKIVAAAAGGRPLSVVVDEVGNPTYADDLVEALVRLVATGRYGVYHFCNTGACSRYEFARYVLDCFGYAQTPITRILKAQWPRPSRPPTYSAMRNFTGASLGITLRDWREAVAAFAAKERQTG